MSSREFSFIWLSGHKEKEGREGKGEILLVVASLLQTVNYLVQYYYFCFTKLRRCTVNRFQRENPRQTVIQQSVLEDFIAMRDEMERKSTRADDHISLSYRFLFASTRLSYGVLSSVFPCRHAAWSGHTEIRFTAFSPDGN